MNKQIDDENIKTKENEMDVLKNKMKNEENLYKLLAQYIICKIYKSMEGNLLLKYNVTLTQILNYLLYFLEGKEITISKEIIEGLIGSLLKKYYLQLYALCIFQEDISKQFILSLSMLVSSNYVLMNIFICKVHFEI